MIPAAFDYVRASSAEEAVSLLIEHGDDAKLLAGGHSLLPLMKLRLATPSVLIDVGRVPDLSYIEERGDEIAIGALARHHELETSALLHAQVPLLAHTAHEVGDPQVRHRGTLGGTSRTATRPPIFPPPCWRSGARSSRRARTAGARSPRPTSSEGFLETALAPDEMLVEIRVPKVPGAGWSFQKFNRRAQDWAIVGVAAVRNGTTGIALVNMGSTPLRATAVEEAVQSGASPADAAALAAEGTEPPTDLNASPEYRRHLATVLVRRALEEASGGAVG